ncbi:MAG: CPBP family glutamic-type intramembrane protease [Promethearchaeota archaeon]|jgi:membrane protease YdiL (CAAX protease family)
MNDKNPKNSDIDDSPINSDWIFCPVCGIKLIQIPNLKFCTNCGTNLEHIKKYKILPGPHISYGPPKLSDEDLINNKDKLWGPGVSIGLPIGAFSLMNIGTMIIFMIIMFITFDPNLLNDLSSNIYIISLLSLLELIFIILPVRYIKKYLQNPTLKNRLALLGFTTKGFTKKGLLKEALIGISLAVMGVIAVNGVAILIELFLEFFFGIEIVQDSSGLSGNPIPLDLGSLILFSIVLILVIGTSEEILFRGFMQKGLIRKLGDVWGILITAVFFALIHLIGLIALAITSPFAIFISFILSFIPYFAISLMLGLLYYWRKENLIAVVIMHGVYDVLVVVIAYLIYGVF